ncbi:MAG: hypothetical protein H6834_09680 [Planctomycetes bacterium]|nr:hypothetical protein [Planctomycetota bacterium]
MPAFASLIRRSLVVALASLALPSLLPAQPTTGVLTLYENSSYGGVAAPLPLSVIPEGAVFPIPLGDRVTSLRWDSLETNVVLTFFEDSNGGGREYTIMHDRARTSGIANVGSYYNDKFSSVSWRRVDPSRGWIRMYTDTAFGGYHLTRYLANLGTSFSINAQGYNDQVDSIQWSVPTNKTIMLYDEDPAGGKALPLHRTGSIRDLDNGFSGIYHDKFSTLRVYDGELDADLADRNAPMDTIAQLMSHNAAASQAHGFYVYNQHELVTWQLDYGARGLMLDSLYENGRLWSVHGSYNTTVGYRLGLPPETLEQVLLPIRGWLDAHPREVITIIFEHQGGTELGDYLLQSSPLAGLIYTDGQARRPSINEMVAMGKRVVIFQQREGRHPILPWQWEHTVENEYSSFGSTTARSESDGIDNKNRALFVMNHINSTGPTVINPPNDVSNLYSLALAFPQIPNFVNLDVIEDDDHGGLEATRLVNTFLWQGRDVTGTQAEYHRFGDDCGGNLLTNTRPVLGRTMTLTSSLNIEALLMGVSDRWWSGISLPFDLGLVVTTTCPLHVSPDVILPTSSSTVPFFIPNDTALAGAELFLQGIRVGGLIALTEGARVRVGQR